MVRQTGMDPILLDLPYLCLMLALSRVELDIIPNLAASSGVIKSVAVPATRTVGVSSKNGDTFSNANQGIAVLS